MKRLLFVGIFVSSIFTNLSSFNGLDSGKQNYLNEKIEGLSARLDELLSVYKEDGDKDRLLGGLKDTRNNIFNNISNENEKKALQKLDDRFRNQDNLPIDFGVQKISNADKIYNITLKLLSPSAIFAVAAIVIIKSIEKMILSGEILKMIEGAAETYRWYTIGHLVSAVAYCLPWLTRMCCGF